MDNQNFVTKYIVAVSLCAEEFLERVATDYNLPIDDLKKRYLYQNEKKFNNTIKKLKPKKTRKVTPYNIFLSDKMEINKLLKENNTDNQTKINKQKGDLWEQYKNDDKILQKYNTIASLENKGLLTKDYRRKVLETWDSKQKTIMKLDNSDKELSLTETLEKLSLN